MKTETRGGDRVVVHIFTGKSHMTTYLARALQVGTMSDSSVM